VPATPARDRASGSRPPARLAPVQCRHNPAISFVVRHKRSSPGRRGHSWDSIGYPKRRRFSSSRTGELFIFRADRSIPAAATCRSTAPATNTSTSREAAPPSRPPPGPWNFTVKGGPIPTADVWGGCPHWPRRGAPPFTRIGPPSIDRLIGGESGSEGVEVVVGSPPIEHYIELTGGLYDTIGAEALGGFERQWLSSAGATSASSTVLGHPANTYFDPHRQRSISELGGNVVRRPAEVPAQTVYWRRRHACAIQPGHEWRLPGAS